MAVKTPEERALGDVEKAIKDYEKAVDKREIAEGKANDARVTEHRALRTLEWTARHPDLADDFDLDAFQQALQAPFDEADVDPVEPDEGEVAAVKEAEAELPQSVDRDDADGQDDDDDNPFGDGADD